MTNINGVQLHTQTSKIDDKVSMFYVKSSKRNLIAARMHQQSMKKQKGVECLLKVARQKISTNMNVVLAALFHV
jgi:hypothetical protein